MSTGRSFDRLFVLSETNQTHARIFSLALDLDLLGVQRRGVLVLWKLNDLVASNYLLDKENRRGILRELGGWRNGACVRLRERNRLFFFQNNHDALLV